MSSPNRAIWVEGQAVDYRELQRMADAAAATDEVVWGALCPPATNAIFGSTITRTILPLFRGNGYTGYERQLVAVPSTTSGKVSVLPALYSVSSASDQWKLTPALSACQASTLDTSLIGANSSGSTRIDLVYATLQWATVTSGSRPYRDASGVSTQSLTLAKSPTITLTVSPGTPGAGVAPSLPSDSATAYNFSVCTVTVLNGYASSGAIDQVSGGAANAYLTQTWNGGGIHQERMLSEIGSSSSTLISYRMAPPVTVYCPVLHTTNPQTSLLVSSGDWEMRRRRVIIRGCRPYLDTTYKAPASITVGGADSTSQFDSKIVFTGTNGSSANPCYTTSGVITPVGGTSSTITLDFWADSAGIKVKFSGDTPVGGGGDHWWIEVEFSGGFHGIV